ncbi:MAG: AMP-binding protein [Bacteroidetes bacterium]|jgi:long-chain acyl-CoA synthetase|nr:AMP-binding protein [Bacteroidota bacterium]
MAGSIHTAPPNTGTVVRGKTLPETLYAACDQYDNPQAFNQPTGGDWTPLSLDSFREQSEEIALGLLDLGLERGDHVALLMESDTYFCLADMGCLIAGLIDVPIYLSHAPEQIQYVIEHSESKALFVSNPDRLEQVAHLLPDLPAVHTVVVAEPEGGVDASDVPDHVELLTLDAVRARGRAATTDQEGDIAALREQIDPLDLATIIYTSGTTGQPKGVMLSHENISFNALTAFSGLTDYEPGADGEVALSFLPLTHIFARALHYGFVAQGTSVYFTHPDNLVEALPKVRPTVFASVPRLLEKVYAGIQKKIMGMTGLQKTIGTWSLGVARQYDMQNPGSIAYALKRTVADTLVFSKWREALGGRLKYAVVGGAALNAELTNVFGAAGITALQGYGLTETSPVIAFNRPERNKPGTVGEPLPGVEVRIADDGEILTRGPHVMAGYYKAEDKTREVLDEAGWFYTGDVGEFDEDGFLRITDRKKDLFKLSTGKYVMPQPIENALGAEPLVEQAVVVGESEKFCAALIFPNEEQLRARAAAMGLDAEGMTLQALIQEPAVVDLYQELVDQAGEGMDHWSTVKRFALVPAALTVESGLLTPTMKVKRPKIREQFASQIKALYSEADDDTARREDDSIIVA